MATPTIQVARHAGVCFGVKRALEEAYTVIAEQQGSIATLGELIHNPHVVRNLEKQGVRTVHSVDEVDEGTLIIRAHGVAPQVKEAAESAGLNVVDATCPFVKRVQDHARTLYKEGYQVIIVGEAGHPEVEGIFGCTEGMGYIVGSSSELAGIDIAQRVGVVVQTTQTKENLRQVVDALLSRAREVRVFDTICSATNERQEAARALAATCDLMIVIGGRNSGNTRRLAQICREECPRSYHIEDAREIEAIWVADASHIGITAGASTPQGQIDDVVSTLKQIIS